MFDVVWQGVGILAMLGFVVASVYWLDRLKKAERRAQEHRDEKAFMAEPSEEARELLRKWRAQRSARLEVQEEHEHGND